MKENYDIGTTNFVSQKKKKKSTTNFTTRSLQTNVALQHVSYFKEKPTFHILSISCVRN